MSIVKNLLWAAGILYVMSRIRTTEEIIIFVLALCLFASVSIHVAEEREKQERRIREFERLTPEERIRLKEAFSGIPREEWPHYREKWAKERREEFERSQSPENRASAMRILIWIILGVGIYITILLGDL